MSGKSKARVVSAPFQDELDGLDARIALREGAMVAVLDGGGFAMRPDGSPYRPTRDAGEAIRLMDKYVLRMARLPHAWIAVGRNGRAEEGMTSLIAACRVAAAGHAQ